jgi:DNA-3-methyladenine glycosylase II
MANTFYKKHAALFPDDTTLQRIIESTQLPVWRSTENVFHDVMSCIIEQQIHYRSSKNVFQYVMQEAGLEIVTVHNFDQLQPALQSLRLSEAKHEAMAYAIDFFSRNDLAWETMTDDEVRKRLSAVQGIGLWTADMILLYTLRRPDIFPKGDYHLTQIMTKVYSVDPKKQQQKRMLQIAERWGQNKSLAVLYLLAYKNILTRSRNK